ncbi:MAG: DUF3426 domain-containing protein [Steroidobacteraceae bacterium]|nr:DUF3426 domain-containing protein [Steroidobacteraceae bacterium]
MYTQCPQCETIFRLSAEILHAASGQVRCGRCGGAFNALDRIAERTDTFKLGESPLDLENRADRILGSNGDAPVHGGQPEDWSAAPENAEPPGRIEHLEIIGPPLPPDDGSLEFTLPPGELDRIFVPPEHNTVWPPPPPPISAAQEAPIEEPLPPAPPVELDRPAPKRIRQGLWLVPAALMLALLLAAQIVNRNREYIAAHTPFGGALRTLYAKLGLDLPVPVDLSDYQLRQWGVTGDPAATGTLHVRASILNTAAVFQPYPLLRVTLTDRFGNRVGTRVFQPREYLGKPAGLMAPGQRADVTINILDPGKDAEGFEIDVCMRSSTRAITCDTGATPSSR